MSSCFGDLRVDPEFDHTMLVAENENGKDISAKPRRPTDSFFIFFMSLVFVLTGILFACSYSYSNIDRIIRGVDDCGNICGMTNSDLPKDLAQCVGKDMTNFPYLKITKTVVAEGVYVYQKTCVESCLNDSNEKSDCQNFSDLSGFIETVVKDLHGSSAHLVVLTLSAIALTGILLLLFRYCVDVLVWVMLIGVNALMFLAAIALWIQVHHLSSDDPNGYYSAVLVYAIMMTFVSVGVLCIIIFLREKVQLVIQLFKEAGKAITTIPTLFIQPIITFIITMAVFIGLITCLVYLQSSGVLTRLSENQFEYQPNGVIIASFVFTAVFAIWTMEFVVGCQDMAISGAIAAWYFIRNKHELKSPLYKSNYNLVRYHLGSVAFGSLIITIIRVVRAIFRYMTRQNTNNAGAMCLRCFANQLFEVIETVIKYLTKNAYVMIALHGVPFCAGGKRAFKLLVENALTTIAMNRIGTFVLMMGKLLVVIINMLIAYAYMKNDIANEHLFVPMIFVFFVTIAIAHFFVVVYENAIDTIFLCFCEDSLENDGIARPYFMSTDLMKFVENAKKIYAVQAPQVVLRSSGNTANTNAVA